MGTQVSLLSLLCAEKKELGSPAANVHVFDCALTFRKVREPSMVDGCSLQVLSAIRHCVGLGAEARSSQAGTVFVFCFAAAHVHAARVTTLTARSKRMMLVTCLYPSP